MSEETFDGDSVINDDLSPVLSPASDTASTIPHCNSDSSLDETDIDALVDAYVEKDIFRFASHVLIITLHYIYNSFQCYNKINGLLLFFFSYSCCNN